jgi:nucleotide-binding universal stress UspA family protein
MYNQISITIFKLVNTSFRKVGLAVAFSPTASALVAEAGRLASLFSADLILIHIGESGVDAENKMRDILESAALSVMPKLIWRSGNPVREILNACKEEKIDLLVAGALKKENLMQRYIGSVARAIMRKAECSVYMVNNPSTTPQPSKQIVVNAEDSPHIRQAISVGCQIAKLEKANWLHIVRELKLLGLALSAKEGCTEQEYNESKQEMVREEITNVEKILDTIPHDKMKINIKIISGKSGFELSRFAQKKQADLLIVGAPPRRFSLFDRMFPHDLEYVFADLPCNLLMVNPRKEKQHG